MIDIETIVNREEYELRDIYSNIEDICSYNSYKVLKAFKDNKVSVERLLRMYLRVFLRVKVL